MPVAIPDFDALHQQCAPYVAKATLKALVKKESGFSPFAIGINRGFRLKRQPVNKAEAIATAHQLMQDGYDFDAGWFQVNVRNIKRLNLSLDDVFDPCENMKISANMFQDNYYRALKLYKNPDSATLAALSAHNTGNFSGGFRNGYVSSVASLAIKYQGEEIPQLSANSSGKPIAIQPESKRRPGNMPIPRFEHANTESERRTAPKTTTQKS